MKNKIDFGDVKITKDEIKEYLISPTSNTTNHWICTCPYCNKPDHFFFNYITFFWDCKKCKESGSIIKLLKHFNVLEKFTKRILNLKSLVKLQSFSDLELEEQEELQVLPNKPKPRGYTRVYENSYLSERNITKNDFYKYNIGTTERSDKLKDYVIFLLELEGGVKGFVSRCTLSKKEIALQNKLRYINSKETKFSEILFGFEEITRKTKTVIIVEGIFDKIRLDNLLQTQSNDHIKVVCSFGNKVSDKQLRKLTKTNVEKIILFFDLDAVQEMKKDAIEIKKHFKIEIACLLDGKDPGDSKPEEIFHCLQNTFSPHTFFYEKCNGRKIKI